MAVRVPHAPISGLMWRSPGGGTTGTTCCSMIRGNRYAEKPVFDAQRVATVPASAAPGPDSTWGADRGAAPMTCNTARMCVGCAVSRNARRISRLGSTATSASRHLRRGTPAAPPAESCSDREAHFYKTLSCIGTTVTANYGYFPIISN
jgi:hypothetical protein